MSRHLNLAVKAAKASWGVAGWARLSSEQRQLEVRARTLGIIANQAVDELDPVQKAHALENIVALANEAVNWEEEWA